MLDNFIQQLGRELNMEDQINRVEPNQFKLPFEDNIEVEASASPAKSYFFKGIIGNCPEQKTEDFLLKTMDANLFGKGTYGAVIGLNEEEKLLTLSLEVDYNSNYREWKEKLQDFVSVLDYWKKEALNHR